jgi:hypothetical protein
MKVHINRHHKDIASSQQTPHPDSLTVVPSLVQSASGEQGQHTPSAWMEFDQYDDQFDFHAEFDIEALLMAPVSQPNVPAIIDSEPGSASRTEINPSEEMCGTARTPPSLRHTETEKFLLSSLPELASRKAFQMSDQTRDGLAVIIGEACTQVNTLYIALQRRR